jgi:hypothetical protein
VRGSRVAEEEGVELNFTGIGSSEVGPLESPSPRLWCLGKTYDLLLTW